MVKFKSKLIKKKYLNINCKNIINMNIEINSKLETYNYLVDLYIDTIHKLIDSSHSLKILPFKIIFSMNYIKKYISDNRLEILQNGIMHLLYNKETILNFDISKLDNLDDEINDNVSIKKCINNINDKNDKNLSTSNDMLCLIIEIKNNAKKLCNDDLIIIKKYFELLIIILEKIQFLFF